MTQPKRRPRLDDEQRKILEVLRDAADDGEGSLVHVRELQLRSGVFYIRQPIDSLKCRGLVDHDGTWDLVERSWKITDAGKEAIS